MQYPSEVIAAALDLQPDPSLPAWEAEQPGQCSHCAAPIKTGDPYSELSAGAFFSSTRDLACFSGIVCWRCVHLRSKTLLNGLSYTVTTATDIYSLAKDAEKAWLFLTPPEPPFVVCHSSSTMQHLSWRTPVTLSRERINVRYGDNLFVVRPALLRQALEYAEALCDRNQGQWIAPLLLDRKAAASYHGRINPTAVELMTESERSFFSARIGPGERWALAYICHSKRPQPQQSEPLTSTISLRHKGSEQ
jgi:CRISPR type IV-associated protein Csf1